MTPSRSRRGPLQALRAAVLPLVLACGTPATATAASEDTAAPLKPYEAVYKTTARGLSIKMTRHLEIDEDGVHTLTSQGKLLVVGLSEVAVFRTRGDRVIPQSYVYQGTGLINRRREIHFTPGSDTIRSLYKNEWYDLPYTDGTLDRMSQQEQLRLQLLNADSPKDDVFYRVADGRKVKDYRLIYVSEELLSTPMGDVMTLHFRRDHDDPEERQSDVWIAPAWDYLMVKTLHIEEGKPVEANLISASIEGVPVRGSATP